MIRTPKYLLILFFGLISVAQYSAQTLRTQAEVDAWDQSITELTTSVNIRGDDITNLDALSNLTSIPGSLNISNCDILTNIDGLENLMELSGRLTISSNEALANINALSNLTSVDGDLTLSSNTALLNINGLSNLTSIEGRLTISYNDLITNVDALTNLTSANGYVNIRTNESLSNVNGLSNISSIGTLTISENNVLTNINALSNIETIDGRVTIDRNQSLVNIEGLNSVQSVSGYLSISYNESLRDIDALSKLSNVDGDLGISYNDSLLDIDGLSNVSSISGSVTIRYNESLANIEGLSSLESVSGSLSISNNDALNDVDPLGNLSSIDGSVSISSNETMANVDGLISLTSIGGTLEITRNAAIRHIQGLGNVSSVTGRLTITNNDALENIDALSNLISIDGRVTIDYNQSLTSIVGLSNVASMPGTMSISNNRSLNSIDALSNLTAVEGTLTINSNEGLIDINGLSNITSVSGNLSLSGNSTINNIDALSQMSSITGRVTISNNNSLTSTDGLSRMTTLEGYLNIERNPMLTEVNGLNNLNTIEGTLNISSNHGLLDIGGLSNLETVSGNLDIEYNRLLPHVDGLSGLTTINGSIDIDRNEVLENVDGLSNLTSIDGRLSVSWNNGLTSIDGLSSVESVLGSIDIEWNESLPNVNGLSGLITIGGNVDISRNDALTNIDGLNSLVILGGSLDISWNESLTNINGLTGIDYLDGYLTIERNQALVDIDGLSNITSIDGTLNLSYNSALTDISSLSNLTSIDGNLNIIGNNALIDIEGLRNVTDISGRLSLTSNDLLSECCIIFPLLNDPSQHSLISIYGNAEGCNSIDEILESTCGLVLQHTSNPPCLGAENGSIEITVSSYDTIPFTYTWEETSTNSTGGDVTEQDKFTIDQLPAGIYNVTVTIPDGDEAIIENIILDPIASSSLDILLVTSENATFGLDNGSISIEFSGGQAPYSISAVGPTNKSLDNISGPTADVNGLLPGDYTLFLYDANNLSSSFEITLIDEDISVQDCAEPMDIIILNLVSEAISAEEYKQSKEYFREFYEGINLGLRPQDSRVAIAEWSGRNQQQIKIGITGDDFLLTNYENLERSFTSGTDILSAMQFGNDYLQANARPNAKKVIIFTFDGCASFSAAAYAQELKETGIIIADVGIGYVNSSTSYRQLLIQAATKPDMAYFGNDFNQLDPLELSITLAYASCSGTTSNFFFNRDGEITIDDYVTVNACPYPESVDLSFTVSAHEQLSMPTGTPVSFYHNDPTSYGASLISTFIIPCSVPAGESESFTVTLPVETATHLYAVLNDGGETSPAFDLPVTDIVETTYTNNIDSEKICVDQYATIQALKSSVSLYPICENIVQYTIDVCNISDVDAVGVEIQDDAPSEFDLLQSTINVNGCSIDNSGVYDIPANCCVSITLSYDVSNAPQGYYGDQDVTIDGPTGQAYLDFDGASTSSEDILLNGQEDCGDPTVLFSKEVNHHTTCSDHSLTYTYYIDNKSSTPIYGLQFTDIIPEPLEWVYKPYDKQGLSIASSQSVEGQTATFIIDEVDAETVASFVIDVYVGYTDTEVLANSAATLQGLPDYINSGVSELVSNVTTTTVLGDIEIDIIDTIILTPLENVVDLEAIISDASSITWSSSGDGVFSDITISDPTYTLGEGDLLDSLIGLFISVTTYCGEKGVSVMIERECELAFDRVRPIELCDGEEQNLSLTWSGGVGPYSINEINENIGTETSIELQPLSVGLYTYTIKDAQGCRSRVEVEVEEVDNPEANITILCGDVDFYDVMIAAGDYSVATENGIVVTDLGQGEYSILNVPLSDTIMLTIMDDISGCKSSQIVTPPDCTCAALAFAPEEQIISCYQETILLDGSDSSQGQRFSVQWSDEDGNILSTEYNYEAVEAGIYVIQVTDIDNNCSVSDTVEVSDIRNDPSASIVSDKTAIICSITDIELTMIPQENVIYRWDHAGLGSQVELDTLSTMIPGEITLFARDTISGCVNQSNILITIDTIPLLISIVDPQVLNCTHDEITLDASSSDLSVPHELIWLDSNLTQIPVTTSTMTTSTAGTYFFQLRYNTNDCVSMDSVIVTEDYTIPELSVDEDYELNCTDDFIDIIPTVVNASDLSFEWTSDAITFSQEEQIQVTSSGTYLLETRHNISECITMDTIIVTTPDGITAVALESKSPLCYQMSDGNISVSSIIGGTPDYAYFLNGEQTTEAELNELSSGEYEFVVEDANGCQFDTIVTLEEPSAIELQSSQELIYVNEGADVLLQVSTDIPTQNIKSVIWEPTIPCDNCMEYLVEDVREDIDYTVTIIDMNGCEKSIELRLIIDSELRVYLPNIMNNQTGDDNIFFPQSSSPDLIIEDMTIHDRWGNKMYENRNFPANDPQYGWDGTYDGSEVSIGVYTYLIMTSYDGERVRFVGTVTLLK